ncbi:MAG: AbrB/MazE/SpoVT family DNA-binding domain-containing protein [Olsenella sp.]|nr:AbrB/MazE/SpoVT family DNA-binding domain-containing protein [Olsenella sp.]
MLATLKDKGQVTIPKKIVNQLGLVSGDTFDVYVEDGEIRFVPVVIYPKKEVERLERLANEAEAQLAHGELPVYDDVESAIESLHRAG